MISDLVDRIGPSGRRVMEGLIARVSSSQREATLAFLLRVIAAAIALGSQILLARWLGPYDFGVYTYLAVWLVMLGTLVTFGTSTSVVRFLPQFRANRDWARLHGFIAWGQALSIAIAVLVTLVGLSAVFALGKTIPPAFHTPAILALLCLPAFALTDFNDGVGRSQGWIDLALGPPYIVRPMLMLICLGISVAAGAAPTAETALCCAIVASFLTAAAQIHVQNLRFQDTPPGATHIVEAGPWLRVSAPFFLLDVLTLLLLNVDLLLLTLFVSPDQLAIYFASSRIMALVAFVHFAVSAVAMPRYASLRAHKDNEGLEAAFRETRALTFWPSLLLAGLLLAFGRHMLALFGSSFSDAYPLLFIFAAGLLARAAGGPVQTFLSACGAERQAAMVLGLTCAAAILLNLALVPWFGLTGAALAMASAFAIEAGLGTWFALRLLSLIKQENRADA